MSKPARVAVVGTMPDRLIQEFLQHIRNFDSAREEPCHFDIAISTDLTSDQVKQLLDDIDPPFPIRHVARKQ